MEGKEEEGEWTRQLLHVAEGCDFLGYEKRGEEAALVEAGEEESEDAGEDDEDAGRHCRLSMPVLVISPSLP